MEEHDPIRELRQQVDLQPCRSSSLFLSHRLVYNNELVQQLQRRQHASAPPLPLSRPVATFHRDVLDADPPVVPAPGRAGEQE
jgi:hypothetical protein